MAISKEAQAVLKAQTAADLVEFLARLLWAKDNPGKDCPPDRIPTTETLAACLTAVVAAGDWGGPPR